MLEDYIMTSPERSKRLYFAIGLTMFSLLAISALGIVAIASAASGRVATTTLTVLATVLPLLGTWVGTILAFYFSSENFETASQGMKEMAKQVATPSGGLGKLKAQTIMIALKDMKTINLSATNMPAQINLTNDVLMFFKPPVSRIPVIDVDGSIKYLIHQSMVFKYYADNSQNPPDNYDAAKATLSDFLAHDSNETKVDRASLAFVGPDATLAESKTAMGKVNGCQDILVTNDGSSQGKVIGWILNSQIAKHADEI